MVKTTRDTRTSILEAAAVEFSEHGFDGTRMERVALRAKCNKALVYRYYEDKDGLFRATLTNLFEKRGKVLESVPDRLGEALVYWFEQSYADRDFLRLVQREALNDRGGEVVREEHRRKDHQRQTRMVDEHQEQGAVSKEFDSSTLFLALLALISYPPSFPTITRLATGLEADSDEFKAKWSRMLETLAAHLVSRSG